MSIPRYAARTAGFALLYLAATLAGALTTVDGVALLWPATAVGAAWLLAQARFGRRDLDVVALGVAAAVVPATGHSLLAALALAAVQVLPALLLARLLDRWLPGYWLGHGGRRTGQSLARLAAIATTAAVAGAVLGYAAAAGDLGPAAAGYPVLRDTTAVLVVVLVTRALRRARPVARTTAGPGRPRLTVVK